VAPVMPPVTVPMVQVKLLGVVAVSEMFGLVLLQIATAAGLVIAGVGFTVTVMVNGAPAHEPVVDVGVTMYCIVPAVELLGLTSVWLIVVPEPALPPVILPLIVPIVQLNVDGAVAASTMLGLVLLQIEAVAGLVIAGLGLTVTVIV
jgi:hypothetical protein